MSGKNNTWNLIRNPISSIGDLEIEDSGKAIKCEAHNNDLFPAPSASVKIEIIVAPVQVFN